jgi:peroxiredoxin Q/BCP
MVKLKVGDKFPDMSLASLKGEVSLAKLKGRNVVVYFYPMDNTPGCTKEAKDFRDYKARFDELGTEIIGISTDSIGSHSKFAEKYGLNFDLVSDESGALCSMCGVTGLLGKTAKRTTFLLDKEGTIRHIWEKVSVGGHAEEVLEAVKKMNQGR